MEKMKFEEFTNAVVEKIREFLPETFKNAAVELNTVIKNNDLKLTGLSIRCADTDICPTIYLEQFFEAYMAGEEMNKVLKEIADLRINTEVPDVFETTEITDFAKAKGKIIPRVIGQEWNEMLLQGKPHKKIEDLAITYHITLMHDNGGISSAAVTDDILGKWGITVEELHEIAVKNMKSMLPPTFRGMSTVVRAMMGEGGEDQEWFVPEAESMFILSNRAGMFGAVSILDKDLMERIIETIGEDFYILPSSIHEMLIVPGTPDLEVKMLAKMVREANASVVEPSDRLSNHVYCYRRNGGLKIAG